MQIKKETSVHINETLTALATAEGVLQTAENALNEKQEQCRADVEEIEVLKKTLSPEDARGIQKLTVLRARAEFYDRPLTELGDAVVRARASLEGRKAQLCDALAAAGKEFDVHATEIARSKMYEITTGTEEFVEWCLPRLSSVWEPRIFTTGCEERSISQRLNLHLAKIAESVLGGHLPPIPRPDPRELQTVLASQIPGASLRR